MTLKRNKEFIEKHFNEKDGKIYTSAVTSVEVPVYFEDKKLIEFGESVTIYGVFMIAIDDYYCVCTMPTTLKMKPIKISIVERNGQDYYSLIFAKNTALIDNTTVIQNKLYSYNLFELFFNYGKIPWYIEPRDILRIMDNLVYYGASNVGANLLLNELLVAYVSRLKSDPKTFLRQFKGQGKPEHFYVDLNDVYYSASTSLNKVAGAYFKQGLVSAIVQKEKKPSNLENHVRK